MMMARDLPTPRIEKKVLADVAQSDSHLDSHYRLLEFPRKFDARRHAAR